MAIDPVVDARLFRGVYICMRCNARIRASPAKIRQGKVLCRRCGYKHLRPKKKGKAAGKA